MRAALVAIVLLALGCGPHSPPESVVARVDARVVGLHDTLADCFRVALAKGTKMADVKGAAPWTSPAGTTLNAMFLAPLPVTKDNLGAVVDAGWIAKDKLCQGVSNGPAPCN